MTILAKLIASEKETMGYIVYVFQCLDKDIIKETKYVMCTRFPNWEHKDIEIGEVGYLSFIEIKAGIDKWYDGNNMIPYRYNNIQFLKFIKKPKKKTHKFIM